MKDDYTLSLVFLQNVLCLQTTHTMSLQFEFLLSVCVTKEIIIIIIIC